MGVPFAGMPLWEKWVLGSFVALVVLVAVLTVSFKPGEPSLEKRVDDLEYRLIHLEHGVALDRIEAEDDFKVLYERAPFGEDRGEAVHSAVGRREVRIKLKGYVTVERTCDQCIHECREAEQIKEEE